MKNYHLTLRANGNFQNWYVRCDCQATAERLVLEDVGSLANPDVTIVDGGQEQVDGIEFLPNKPVQL